MNELPILPVTTNIIEQIHNRGLASLHRSTPKMWTFPSHNASVWRSTIYLIVFYRSRFVLLWKYAHLAADFQTKFQTWLLQAQVFFFGGGGVGDWGSLEAVKILPVPPICRPGFLTRACPPNWVLSPKIWKFLPHFSLNFDYFLAQNCIRKLYFMLKTPKFALILLQEGIFGFSGQNFQVPHIWLRPRQGLKIVHDSKHPPTKNFLKKNPEALSFEVCKCDSIPSHTLNDLQECDLQHT